MVKVKVSDVDSVVAQPGPALAGALLYGPDRGLVRERAGRLTAAIAGDAGDPFRVVEIDAAAIKDDPARLADEAAAFSFTGGRRVVRLRGAADGLSETLAAILEAAGGSGDAAFVVVEAGELGPRSSLRRLFETADNAAALACYVDEGQTLAVVIREALASHDLSPTPDATAFLLDRLGGDRLVTRSELDKLALYAAGKGEVTLEDAAACIGDTAALAAEDAVFAAAEGDFAALDRGYARLLLEGTTPVAVLRAALRHVQRLHQVVGAVDRGETAEQAMGALRPMVFFKHKGRFRTQLRWWSAARLGKTMLALVQAECACKETGARDAALAERALLMMANAAARARRAG